MEFANDQLKGSSPLQRLPIGARIAAVAVGITLAQILPILQWLGFSYAHRTGMPLPFQFLSQWMRLFQLPFFLNVFMWIVILIFMVDRTQRRQFSNWFLGTALLQMLLDSTLRNSDYLRSSSLFQVSGVQFVFWLLYGILIGGLRGIGLAVGLGAIHLVGRTVILFAAIEVIGSLFHSHLARSILATGTAESITLLQLVAVFKAIVIGIIVAFAVFWLRRSAVRQGFAPSPEAT